jgi:hypothetical protein
MKRQFSFWRVSPFFGRLCNSVFVFPTKRAFLISNFRRVLYVVRFLLGNLPASVFYTPTFRNTLFHLHRLVRDEFHHLLAYEDGTDRVFRNVGI